MHLYVASHTIWPNKVTPYKTDRLTNVILTEQPLTLTK